MAGRRPRVMGQPLPHASPRSLRPRAPPHHASHPDQGRDAASRVRAQGDSHVGVSLTPSQARGRGLHRTKNQGNETMWEPSQRYPDPAVEILDPSFAKYRIALASVERLATGFRWCEGPVWFGDGRYLLWSDIPNNRVMKWEEETGAVSVFRKPSNNANGNTRDRQRRLVTCEHDARPVTRTEYDGSITVLLERFEGKQLNSPNDVVVKSDDSIWF